MFSGAHVFGTVRTCTAGESGTDDLRIGAIIVMRASYEQRAGGVNGG